MSKADKKILKVIVALLMFISVTGGSVHVRAEDEFYITVQPEDVEVNYPDGATFHVEVSQPERVASYQWYLSDDYNNVFELNGETAKTDTLVMPSTEPNVNPNYLSCIITDVDGNRIFSEDAVLTIGNAEEEKPVLYFGNYALEPGESLDLATTSYGSGKVTYEADGLNATFENIQFDNTVSPFDQSLGGLGVFFHNYHAKDLEYTFRFKGDCLFNNTFYDPDYNAAGVVINSFFGIDDGNQPTLIIDAQDSLTLIGGSNSIYSDGNVELKGNISCIGMEDVYNDSITCVHLLVDEGSKLDLRPNGTALRAHGDMRIYPGAEINIDAIAPHVSAGPTFKNLVYGDGNIYFDNCKVYIAGNAHPETFIPYGSYLVNLTGISVSMLGSINLKASDVTIDLTAEKGDDLYALNYCGIIGGENSSSLLLSEKSKLSINIDCEDVMNSTGILVPGTVSADDDCMIKINIATQGEVAGIEADRDLQIKDAIVEVNLNSLTSEGVYGVVTGDAAIEFNKPDYYLYVNAANGIGLAADSGERGDVVGPVENYTAQKIILSGKATYLTPKKATVNLYGVPGYDGTIKAETVFDSTTMAAPASEVQIGVKPDNTIAYVVGIAAVAAIAIAAYGMSKKNKKKKPEEA